MTKKTDAIAKRMSTDDRTPEQHIEVVRGYLDKMEVVQLQHATGAILIGLELLALKDQLGRGEFLEVFEQQIERPRFSLRSAQRYMADAHNVRRQLKKEGSVSLAGILSIAPSDLPMAQQRKLQGLITEAVGDRTLTGLRGALGSDVPRAPKQLTAGAPATGKEAEMAAHAQVWTDLCKTLTREAVNRKSWKFLDPAKREHVRNAIKQALEEIPA